MVRGWHFGRFAAMRSTAARESLTEITPALLRAFARAGNPDAAAKAFDSLLRALPAGAQLFALLRNNRELLDLLATILSAAPRLAEVFARRPHVADALLAPRGLGETGGGEIEASLGHSLSETRSYEDVLDRVRLFVAEQRFLISVGLLNGTLAPAEAGKAFSDLAEAIVRALLSRTEEEFARQHGRLPRGRAAVVAFGRLGSREMTAGSDLDLMVVYDHAPDAVSDGKRPLAPSQYYARLTQRLTAALAAPTAEGIAYEVDLRLRPSGRKGPLATYIEAFQSYQISEAWTWEHMAMSRGRAIAGDAGLMAQVSAVIDALAAKERDRAKLAADVASMRGRIQREGKSVASPFDVKLARGGLMDCEFAAQFLVLAGLGRVAGETTVEILRRAADQGQVRPEEGERLILSAALQGALLQIERVATPNGFSVEEAPEALKGLIVSVADGVLRDAGVGGQRSGVASFEELEARLGEVQAKTRKALENVLGVPVG
jgi:glutamate-ammonia-ligase adenylyltransferase